MHYLHHVVEPSQECAPFLHLCPVPKPKSRLSRSQNRSEPSPAVRSVSPKTRIDPNAPHMNPVVELEKIEVPPQDNSSVSQPSDSFSTPKRPSKLSLSNTRKSLNVHKHSNSESFRLSQVSLSSSPGTCSADVESSGSPTIKQNTLFTRKAGQNKTGRI